MSYQKCPLCNGEGRTLCEAPSSPKHSLPEECRVCKGTSIIHSVTGLPPSQPTAKLPYVPELKAEEIVKPLSVLDDYTDEEILYYSSPYYDVLQAQKQKQLEQRNEDEDKKL